MKPINNGILNGLRKEIESTDPFERPVRIFLYFVGVLTDFHEASDGVDTLSHNADTVRKSKLKASSSSRYAYATTSHSDNPSYRRSVSRHKKLREDLEITGNDTKYTGIHVSGEYGE